MGRPRTNRSKYRSEQRVQRARKDLSERQSVEMRRLTTEIEEALKTERERMRAYRRNSGVRGNSGVRRNSEVTHYGGVTK